MKRPLPALSPARQQLIEGCQGLVRSIAWKIHQRCKSWVELDDLIAYGQVGLAEAAARFDESQGAQFTTFAYQRVRGAIFDGLSKMEWFSRAAFWSGRYERMSREVLEHTDSAADSADDVRWLTDVGVRLAVSYFASGVGAGESDVADPQAASPQVEAILVETRERLRAAIARLPDDARQLIELTYFQEMTLKDAGERLGISKSWASRLHDRTLRALASALRDCGAEQPA